MSTLIENSIVFCYLLNGLENDFSSGESFLVIHEETEACFVIEDNKCVC